MNNGIQRFLSFIVCLLMMTGAAINCNKSILGKDLTQKHCSDAGESAQESPEAITFDDEGNVIINTTLLSDATGFSGKTPLEMTISKDGDIINIIALPNTETPGFFSRASVILDNWKGCKVDDALTKDVDAVTGATMSSDALKDNVNKGLTLYANEIEHINASRDQHGAMPWKLWVALGVTLMACILPLFIKNKTYHVVQMILNVIVLGFWCGQFISYGLMVNWLSSGLGMWRGLIPILMLAAAFIYPVFGKRQHYCTHVCPLGSIQQLAGMCTKSKIKIPKAIVKTLEWFRRILWAVLMFCLWIPVMTEWMDYELFSAFMVESASMVVLVCAAAVVVLSVFITRPYCRFICPTGTLIKIEEKMFDKK